MQTKKCNTCKQEKIIDLFHRDRNRTLGRRSECKACVKVYQLTNKQKLSEYNRNFANSNRIKNQNRNVYTSHETGLKVCKICQQTKEVRQFSTVPSHFDGLETRCKPCNSSRATAQKAKRAEKDPVFKFSETIRKGIQSALFYKKPLAYSRVSEVLGCDYDTLRRHIESLWQPGMTWENYGVYGWHIDHIVPKSKFDLSTLEGQKQANNYKNLQPMWATENLKKSNKV